MKKEFRKYSSLAIVGLLLFTGCLDMFGTDDVIGNNLNPVAVVNVSGQRVVDLGSPIQFDASESTDEDGTVTSYSWDFGDGETGTNEQEFHKYLYPGDYIVSLSVTDNKGAVGNNDRRLTYITILHPEISESSNSSEYQNGRLWFCQFVDKSWETILVILSAFQLESYILKHQFLTY